MIEHDYTIVPKANENGKAIFPPQLLAPPTFPGLETDVDDWSLKQLLAIIKRRGLVIIGFVSLAMAGVTYTTLKQEAIYQGNFQLLVEPVNRDGSLDRLAIPDTNFGKSGLDYESQIQVLKSQELMQGVVNQLQISYPEINYYSLISDLSIRRIGETKVIDISYRNQNASKIKFVLDAISKYYLNYSLEKRKTQLNQGVQFVDKQLPTIKNRVTQLQQQLQIFRQRYSFMDPGNQSGLYTGQLQGLEQQRLEIDKQLASARAAYSSLSKPEGELATLNSASIYQQLISQLRQLEAQISGELVRFQPDNPAIETLQEKRRNLLPIIEDEANRYVGLRLAEAAAQIQRLEVESQELAKVEQRLKLRFEQLPILARQYSEIQRDLQLANDSLNRFLATRETLQIQVAQTEIPWELIQAPIQPLLPISPDIPRNLMLGFIGSLIGGIAIALLLEKLDNTYHTVDSIKDTVKMPVLGTLPFDKKIQSSSLLNVSNLETETEIPSTTKNRFSSIFDRSSSSSKSYGQGKFWESLQVLYANIQLLNPDQQIRSLVISSAMPADGKSTVALNLAQIATVMGKRVLLVDADMRRPSIHKTSGLHNLSGLSSLISSNMPVDQVIQPISSIQGLSVITAGPVPPDPVRLLSSDKMKQLMAHFQANFDLVIYDVPPMLGLVDARLLAQQADGIALVVRIDKTDKSGLSQLQDNLKLSSVNLLGIIVNGDKAELNSYNYYYGANNQSNPA
ncbi:polysaccharide biosynthesis tyrosine autokinase [Cronbergia sp. UHCC 0137]|uniref:GumC family protein n=1 Tax=Cronbergia sp. UHCC 0137 TaxID=3110239 RepID=UPI002B21C120|nr:polysaccharide biosynthesis tyrosine autokinase [Cronbergia sp. UHCC 0137]MEA5619739.1 polysaccharide biosynthesis tyrosine autokinase [Cronbergia sp. UHCC 0137]